MLPTGEPPPRTASEVLDVFTGWLATRSLAATTRLSYVQRVAGFLRWLEADGGPTAVAAALVDRVGFSAAARGWRRHQLAEAKASAATVNLGIAALGALGECLGLGAPDTPRVATTRITPQALGDRDLRSLLVAAERSGPRDHALVAMLTCIGLRIGEAAALDVDDVSTTARTGMVHVRADKGEQPRSIPLTGSALAPVRAWLSTDPRLADCRGAPPAAAVTPAVWVGRTGRLSVRSLQRDVARVGAAAGIDDLHPHRLRHTAATRWLSAGVDIVTVAELLGHSLVETTRLYTRPTTADMVRAAAAGDIDS